MILKKFAVLALSAAIFVLAAFGFAEAALKDGSYKATARGIDGIVTVEVTFANDKIADIKILDDNETAGVGDKALEIVRKRLIENQSLAVEGVSGATVSSNAIRTAVADAIKQAGGDASEWRNRKIERVKENAEYNYDIVVVGAGLAGLTAALTAEQQGAKVALLEKQGIVGGTSIFSSGTFLAAETEETIPEVVKAWLARNTMQDANKVDVALVESLLKVSPAVVKMYKDLGVEFRYTNYAAAPLPSERAKKNAETIKMADVSAHSKGGEALITALEAQLLKDGVDIYLNTPATGLIVNDSGTVTGVVSETDKTGTKKFNAKVVILCTGDYARNNQLNAELAPETVGEYTATAKSNTGDGLKMALELGAGLHAYQESMSGNFHADPFDMPVVGQPNNPFPFSVLLVDRKGNRKVSEAAGPHAQQVFFIYEDEPDHAWAIMDQDIADKFLNLEKYLAQTQSGHPFIKAFKADSIEELAKLINIDPEVLAKTVADYNALCESGKDTQFGKPEKYLKPLNSGAYYAVKEYDMTRGNYGGILTNADFQVVKSDGSVIPGLYAAGLISSGSYFGDFYPGREALSLCAHGGYIAAMNALKAVK